MHPEAISLKMQKVFKELKHFPQFYLGGGTALALQIGHRMSDDFDLFSEKDNPNDLLEQVEKIFKNSKVDIITNHSEQLSVIIDQIKVDFVRYPFPLILDLIKYKETKIIKVSEIAAMKAYTIGRRASYKDYVDLYFILSEKQIFLPEIIKISRKKFKEQFDPRLFLEQLIYLEDVNEEPIKFLKEKVGKKGLEDFFQNEIKGIKL